MFIIALSVAGLVFLLVLIVFQGTVRKDIFRREQLRAMTEQTRYHDEELEKSLAERFIIPAVKGVRSGVSRLASRTSRIQRNEANKAKRAGDETGLRPAACGGL